MTLPPLQENNDSWCVFFVLLGHEVSIWIIIVLVLVLLSKEVERKEMEDQRAEDEICKRPITKTKKARRKREEGGGEKQKPAITGGRRGEKQEEEEVPFGTDEFELSRVEGIDLGAQASEKDELADMDGEGAEEGIEREACDEHAIGQLDHGRADQEHQHRIDQQ
jgi:hypothetical protein